MNMKLLRTIPLMLALAFAPAFAQEADGTGDDIDSLFGSPDETATSEDLGGEPDGAAGTAGETADDIDSLFETGDEAAGAETPSGTIANPEEAFLETEGLSWNGEFTGKAEAQARWEHLPPEGDEWGDPDYGLIFELSSKLGFDARPDRDFRVAGRFKTAYPFSTTALKDMSGKTAEVPALSVLELFADFTWKDRVFFRFGKQTAAWGLSRFYQVADPISTEVKDPQNPAVSLEGPVALKISVPVGMHTLFGYAVAKDSYLPADLGKADLGDLGYGLKGDFFLKLPENPVLSDAELTAGGYWQEDLAPRAVFGVSTGIGDVSVFSDQVLSWGRDSYRLTDEEVSPGVFGLEKDEDSLFYSATVGFMYENRDLHMTLYGEYFYNGYGSTDPEYFGKLILRYGYEQSLPAANRSLSVSDLAAYQSAHNSALSLSFSELAGSDKWSAGVYWQQNWTDGSGLVVPSVTWAPMKHFSITAGARVAFGGDDTEFVTKLMDTASLDPRRLTGYLGVSLGSGKF